MDPQRSATLSVRELTAAVRDVLHATFPAPVWVEGEITSLSRPANGHVYFTLVEPAEGGGPPVASLPIVLFDSDRRRVNAVLRRSGSVRMTDGVWVRLRGSLTLYPPSGRIQLRMTAIDPDHTMGRLAAAREALLARLRDEQLVDVNASRPIPELPAVVGLVTSAGTAAHADVVGELTSSTVGLRVVLADITVQGPDAATGIAAGIEAVCRAGAEVVLVVRGGGARTDLVPFDDERVARAIAAAPAPVLTGVGHDVDVTVADAMAHRAFKTPTAAAAFVAARATDAARRLDAVVEALSVAVPARLERRRADLERSRATVGRLAVARLDGADRRVAHLALRCASRSRAGLHRHGERTEMLAGAVRALDPARALDRGWSITRRADGSLVRSATEVVDGDELVTTVADGSVRSRVTGSDPAGQRSEATS